MVPSALIKQAFRAMRVEVTAVDDTDKTVTWMSQAGMAGYYSGDFNMDNQIDNKDKNSFWVGNNGYNGQVPE